MPFDKKILADSVVTRLIEGLGLYQFSNRSFDGLVRPGATSVDIPSLAVPLVKTAGTAPTNADRKKTKTGTTMVNVPLTAYAVPLADEIAGMFESGGKLIQEFIISASAVLAEKFDELVLTQAETTTYTDSFSGATLSWKDITAIVKHFNTYKVPRSGRVIAIPAALSEEFYDIDVIKNAVGFNKQALETGDFISVLGMKFFISGVVPQINAKEAIVGFYGPGIASIISKMGDVEEAWDGENLQKNYDVLAHAGFKLLANAFAVTRVQQ